jgi:putative acyl-CoA dehydrogenase
VNDARATAIADPLAAEPATGRLMPGREEFAETIVPGRPAPPGPAQPLAPMDVLAAQAPGPCPRATGTHEVRNMPADLPGCNAFTTDPVITAAIGRSGASWAEPEVRGLGELIGSPGLEELARAANKCVPVLHTHDRFGRRLDRVEFHPAYHELMRLSYASKVHSLPWTEQRPGAQLARAAISYLWNQGENGIGCLNVMSYSIVPLLRANPEVGRGWEAGVLSPDYDGRHLPAQFKNGLTVAMSMTEKQGGSDLRRNETRATPTATGAEYVLHGHKFFCSAPMGDVILLTAQTENGVSLFLAPRLLPDGSHNGIFIQRLKDKLGNRSNASSEIEINGTLAYLLGEEGHGIREFIRHMTHYIRMDFSVASVGIMRRALVLACQHVRHRSAFGSRIADLPQMQNALADLALEWEASLLLGLRMAEALDQAPHSAHDHDLLRIGVPIAKYWNCRRASRFVLEALECHGGMGYVEEQPVARLLREAPLNSIWEGTAAMMGLDFARTLNRDQESRDALLAEIRAGTGSDHRLEALASALEMEIEHTGPDLEAHARRLMDMAAISLQASLLNRYAPAEIADLFIASRVDRHGGVELGTLPSRGSALAHIAERAVPA